MKLQILMPMAGLGSRFRDAGYSTPKPLIEVDGLPMFIKALTSLDDIDCEKEVHFIIRQEHVDEYKLDNLIITKLPTAKITVIPEMTRGAAETALATKNELNPEDPLIIMDCDLWFNSDSYNQMVERSIANRSEIDGGLLTFRADNPRYSYAEIDENGFVQKTAEKKVISNNAITGAYYFNRAETFIKSAENLLNIPISDQMKEYYISLIYNIVLKNGGKIKAAYVDKFDSFGTPEELEDYQKKYYN